MSAALSSFRGAPTGVNPESILRKDVDSRLADHSASKTRVNALTVRALE